MRLNILCETPCKTVGSGKCSEPGCESLKDASLHGRDECRAHFLGYCYDQIERCEQLISRKEHWNAAISNDAYDILSEIADAAAAVGLGPNELSDIERAQIIHILSQVEILIGHFRRYPRKEISIPVTIKIKPSAAEECVTTRDVSLKGASLKHTIPLSMNASITLRRPPHQQEKDARVIWTTKTNGGFVSGVELIDSYNFWEPELSE